MNQIFFLTALIGIIICLTIDIYNNFIMYKFNKLSQYIKEQESRRLK